MKTSIRLHPGYATVALLSALTTAYVLLEDVMRHGAPFTTSHLMSAVALVVTIASGLAWWPTLRDKHIVHAALLAIVFLAGTFYVVTMSGARNSEVHEAKVAAVRDSNAQRQAIEKMIADAEYILQPCPAGTPAKHRGQRCGMREAMAAECGTGKGTACAGRQYTVQTYEAALRGHREELRGLSPQKTENAGLRHFAEILATLPWVTADIERITYVLALWLPYIAVLITEVSTLAFGHLSVRIVRVEAKPSPKDSAQTSFGIDDEPFDGPNGSGGRGVEPPKPNGSTPRDVIRPKRSSERKDQVLAALLTDSGLGKPFARQADLAERFGMPSSTLSEWMKEWEQEGLIPKRRMVGRCKTIA